MIALDGIKDASIMPSKFFLTWKPGYRSHSFFRQKTSGGACPVSYTTCYISVH